MDTEKTIISVGTTDFVFTQDYPHRISRHEVKDRETLLIYHYVPKFEKGDDGLLKFVVKEEELWFEFRPADKELSLRSDCILYYNRNYNCSDSAFMVYLRKVKGAKLVASRALNNYDEGPYGRSVVVGKFLYEVWDIRGLWE